jgi:hypothetical protein
MPGMGGALPVGSARGRLEGLDILPNTNPAYMPSFVREPDVWGALYAVEGSRLGNRIILLRVMECGSEAERRAHGARSWRGWRPYNIAVTHSSRRRLEPSECSKRISIR